MTHPETLTLTPKQKKALRAVGLTDERIEAIALGTDDPHGDTPDGGEIRLTDKQRRELRTAGLSEERIAAIESGAVEEADPHRLVLTR